MRSKNILHIDDNQEDCDKLFDALKSNSFVGKYTALLNPIEALRKLTTQVINPDLIFMDLNMPGINGFTFLEKMNAIPGLSKIPVIILTASPLQGYIKETKNLGAADYIIKPKSIEALAEILRRTEQI